MTFEKTMLVALWVAVGGIVGWAFVPVAADTLLRRAHRRCETWWWESYRAYRAYREAHMGEEPRASASGEEGALGLWRSDAIRSARTGALARDQALALADAGIVSDADACTRSEGHRRHAFAAQRWQRSACACGCAIAFAGLGALVAAGVPIVQAVALACCAVAMAVAIVCDMQARTVPLETCAVLAGAGALFQLLSGGIEGLAFGAACGVFVVVGCIVANRMLEQRGALAVGYGDIRCMAALSLTCGASVPWGLAACYASAGIFSLAGIALRRFSTNDGIPMAPFLALWLAYGSMACLAA